MSTKLWVNQQGTRPQFVMDTKKNQLDSKKVYSFDISMADQIFDHLLTDKVIKLLNGHILPTAEQMKKKKKKTYCKWHGMLTQQTVHYQVFQNAFQVLINKETLKFFQKGKDIIKVDSNPFPSAKVDIFCPTFQI